MTSHRRAESSISPRVWGPACWRTMYSIARSYPDAPSRDDQLKYLGFYDALFKVLPCSECRQHCAKYISAHPLNSQSLSSRDALFVWLIAFNNAVNARLGKKQITKKDVMQMIADTGDTSDASSDAYAEIAIIVICVAIIVGVLALSKS